MNYLVQYSYDGGSCTEMVEALDAETATREVMSRAKPKWNPGAECVHRGTQRILSYDELVGEPHGGIVTAVDIDWDRRDTGRAYLVLERGDTRIGGRSYWLTGARIVATCATDQSARSYAERLRREASRRGVSGRYDVVPRAAVRLESSGAAYGCMSGERAAS